MNGITETPRKLLPLPAGHRFPAHSLAHPLRDFYGMDETERSFKRQIRPGLSFLFRPSCFCSCVEHKARASQISRGKSGDPPL